MNEGKFSENIGGRVTGVKSDSLPNPVKSPPVNS